MRGIYFVVLIFLILGLASTVISVFAHASAVIIYFHIGYLSLVSALGYIQWKKKGSA